MAEFDFSNEGLYNPSYIPMLYNNSEFIHYFGGAGSGKSRFVAQKEIISSFDPNRLNRKTIVVRKVAATLRDSCYAELCAVIRHFNVTDCFKFGVSPLSLINLRTNVEFLFKGFDDPEKIKSIEGADRIWYEEATESTSKDELDQLRLRLRGFDQVQLTLSYNPINVFHYLNTEYHQKTDPRHFLFKTTYRDNVKMLEVDSGYANYIESTKDTNPNYYRVYGLGLWGQNHEGLVYPDYTIVDKRPKDDDGKPVIHAYGLDFGFNDPCAMSEVCVIDEFGKDRKQLYVNEILYKTKLTSDDLIAELHKKNIRRNIPIIADHTPAMIEALRRNGFWVIAAEKGKDSIKAGINTVKLHDIHIIRGSKETLKEIGNYSWKIRNGEWMDEPQGGADHMMDSLRYATCYITKPTSSGSIEFNSWI